MEEKNQNKRTEYRHYLAEAIVMARKFDGSEKSYLETMRKLIGLEEWLTKTFGNESNKRLPDETERRILQELKTRPEHTITGILEIMAKRLKRILESPKINVVTTYLRGVLLPPGNVQITEGTGERVEKREIRFDERLQMLLEGLQPHGIFLDDVIVCQGDLTETMMRQESYYLVEIPRINKEILVCRQVGEATFVVKGILSRNQLMTMSKELLQETYPDRVTRVVFRDKIAWLTQIISALELESGSGEKIDVGNYEQLRNKIKAIKPTHHDWAKMNSKERAKFQVAGMGMMALAKKFGVKGDRKYKSHLELGKKIYGDDPAFEISEISIDELKEQIKAVKPTPQDWVHMKKEEKPKFRVAGMGMVALARKFGVEGNLFSHRKVFFELGKKIYGDDPAFEISEISIDELKEQIKAVKPMPQDWASMSHDEQRKFDIAGIGVFALATRFCVGGGPTYTHNRHLELGRKIYGDDPAFIYEEVPEISIDELTERIKIEKPTPQDWVQMKPLEKRAFRICGIALGTIADKFDIEGNPISYRKYFLELGKKIYGDDPAFYYEKTPELSDDKLKEAIKAVKPTPQDWVQMKQHEKRQFKIGGLGLFALERRFGIEGNRNYKSHLELGENIYGDDPAFEISEISIDELKEQIKAVKPTPYDWEKMSYKERVKFRVAGIGIVALATRFGIDEPVIYKQHLKLGEKIYGANPIFHYDMGTPRAS